jgi:hypothetical protein
MKGVLAQLIANCKTCISLFSSCDVCLVQHQKRVLSPGKLAEVAHLFAFAVTASDQGIVN